MVKTEEGSKNCEIGQFAKRKKDNLKIGRVNFYSQRIKITKKYIDN